MKIYLAGKMDELGDWRDGLLGVDREWDIASKAYRTMPRWRVRGAEEDFFKWGDDQESPIRWPVAPNTLVLGDHEYVGPYRCELHGLDSKYYGSRHGNDGRGQHGWMDNDEERTRLMLLCFGRVRQSDIVFAYLNSFDSFGTLVELGYAAACGKYIAIVEDNDAVGDGQEDLWFIHSLAHDHHYYHRKEWTAAGETVHGSEHEARFLRDHLLQAISACAAWHERRRNVVDIRLTASQSFQQIVRWTSDPRVRDEARRMIGLLETGRG